MNFSKYFLRPENNDFTRFLFESIDFKLFGGILKMNKNMDFIVRDCYFDMDTLSFGFDMRWIDCQYPEA